MDDNIDQSLSINFFSPSNFKEQSARVREKVSADRRQRIRKRKALKHARQRSENEIVSEVDPRIHPTETREEDDVQSKPHEFRHRPHAKEVISSLFRKNPEIPVVESTMIKPVTEQLFSSGSFKDAPLHPYMVSNLEKLGFSQMTTVQQLTIPQLMAGHDTLVQSQTGSGKTLAYAIPIVQDLQGLQPKLQRSDGPVALVIVPTRELALQSFQAFQKLLKPFMWIVPGCIMGGEKRKAEKARLRKGVNILVATPGRLIDHLDHTSSLNMNQIKWVVLDEADRLLDLGYEKDVSRIITALNKQKASDSYRQTVLLSATLSEGVERLAGVSLQDPVRVNATKSQSETQVFKDSRETTEAVETDTQEESFALPENLVQQFVITPCKLRLVTLIIYIISKCLVGRKSNKMIVFLATQDSVEFHYRLVRYLTNQGHTSDMEEVENTRRDDSLNVYRLHGDMQQQDRTRVYQEFCTTPSGVLLCTDVAARGLHLPAVKWVVQYTCPTMASDYIHRVGRTARVGSKGHSLLFLMPEETEYVKVLNEQKIRIEECHMSEILNNVMKVFPSLPEVEDGKRDIPRTVEEGATYVQLCCEQFVRRNTDMAASAKKAFQSYVRAYATYPSSLKSIFHVKHLHLGHVAKAFALRDAPSGIGGTYSTGQMTQQKRKRKNEKEEQMKKKRKKQVSEFTSSVAFTSTTKPAFKKRKKLKNKRKTKPGK